MLRFIGLILSSIFAVLGFFWEMTQHFCTAAARSLGIAPTIPPTDDEEQLEEIAREDAALQAVEDLNVTRNWATAQLFSRPFKFPDTTVGKWLSALDISDAERVARADGAGVLGQHLAGRELVPGLPPVADEHMTRRWIERKRPVNPPRPREVEQAMAPEVDGYEHDAEVYEFRRAA